MRIVSRDFQVAGEIDFDAGAFAHEERGQLVEEAIQNVDGLLGHLLGDAVADGGRRVVAEARSAVSDLCQPPMAPMASAVPKI